MTARELAETLEVSERTVLRDVEALAEEADRLSTWFLHDPDPWTGNRIPHGELRRLARSVDRRREVEITLASDAIVTVRPLGLVLKAGSWHVVTLGAAGIDVVCIDDLRGTRLTSRRFAPPPGFELASFWKLHNAHNA